MPNLVGPETLDTVSTNGDCKYPPLALGAGILVSPNIFIGGKPLGFAHAARVPDGVPGVPLTPDPCTIPVAPRILINKVNKTVHINGFLAMVQGDSTQALGTDRPFVGPYQLSTVVLASTAS